MQRPDQTTALQGFDVLRITGRDAVSFAQAQFCNDVGALAVGHWQFNGWLTPKGRVMALFALLKVSGEELLLVLPGTPATELASRLQAFVFRAKARLEPAALVVACAGLDQASSVLARGSAFAAGAEGSMWLDFGGEGGPRWLGLLAPDAILAPRDAEVDAAWHLHDLQHGFPRIAIADEAGWTPQMLSLDRLGAYSVRKGCYPGQEIVARTHFLGQAKRGLVRLLADGPLSLHSRVTDSNATVLGPVVDVAAGAGGFEALAVLPAAPTPEGLQVEGQPVRAAPLLGGLGRGALAVGR